VSDRSKTGAPFGAYPGTRHEHAVFPNHRILVVDDNIDTADSEALLLTQMGQTVQQAYSGAHALGMAEEFRPDIVLLDLRMRGMDGYEVARRLRQMPSMRGTRIIAYSGYGRPEDDAAIDAAGFDDFSSKPMPLSELIKILSLEKREDHD
jgi:CheY-like chemotaxis protein